MAGQMVWVLETSGVCDEGSEIAGVYSTREKCQAAMEELGMAVKDSPLTGVDMAGEGGGLLGWSHPVEVDHPPWST